MEHLLEAPPLVHRDHREAARVVRDLLEAAELADRDPHCAHLQTLRMSGAVLTFAARDLPPRTREALTAKNPARAPRVSSRLPTVRRTSPFPCSVSSWGIHGRIPDSRVLATD